MPASTHSETPKFLDVVTMTEEELLVRFDCGGVTDGKTVAALFSWLRRR